MSQAMLDKALVFAKAHCLKEPTREEKSGFLTELSVKVRAALGVSEHAKSQMRRKPDNWKEDIRCAFTKLFLTFRAWTKQ